VALPVMEDSSSVGENIRMFKIVVSILILIQVLAVSLIATRLRGGGFSSALGQSISFLWIAGLTSLLTAVILDAASSIFSV